LRDLIGVNVELLRQLGQRLLALDGGQSHFRLECRAVVPARSFRHRLSPDPQPSWPLSGRNSTYQIVEICRASSDTRKHVQSLIDATQKANISNDDRKAIAHALTFQTAKSIGQLGRDLAKRLLPDEEYESMSAAKFFRRIYDLRNDMVHHGKIDPSAIHAILGETDRFVSDLLKHHYAKSSAPSAPDITAQDS
jgi:hypothetical protein